MEKRNPFAVLGLSLVTLGLYHPYWLMKVDEDLKKLNYNNLPSWILFPAYIAAAVGSQEGVPEIFALFSFAGSVFIIIWLYRFGESMQTATNGAISKAAAFLAPLLVGAIGDALVQSKLNKFIDGDTSVGVSPAGQNQVMPQQQPAQPPMTEQQTPAQPLPNNSAPTDNTQPPPTQPQDPNQQGQQ